MSEEKNMIAGVTPLSSIQVLDNGDVVQVGVRQQLYNFIEAYLRENNYPPTYREMMDGVEGINSTSVAAYHLQKLRREGCIDYVDGKGRTITLLHPPEPIPASLVLTDSEHTCAVPGCNQPRWRGPRGLNMGLPKCEGHQREEWRDAKSRSRGQTEQTEQRGLGTKSIDLAEELANRLEREKRAHAETKRLLKQTQEELEQLKARRADIRSKIQPPTYPVEDKREGSEAML